MGIELCHSRSSARFGRAQRITLRSVRRAGHLRRARRTSEAFDFHSRHRVASDAYDRRRSDLPGNSPRRDVRPAVSDERQYGAPVLNERHGHADGCDACDEMRCRRHRDEATQLPRPTWRTMIVSAVLLAASNASCSLVLVDGPLPGRPLTGQIECTTGRAAPIVDTIVATHPCAQDRIRRDCARRGIRTTGSEGITRTGRADIARLGRRDWCGAPRSVWDFRSRWILTRE